MYRTEKDFVSYLSDKLKQEGFSVTRIESHSTGVGIPDMFVMGHGMDFFIEAKNTKRKFNPSAYELKVDWRPGQVAWAMEYAVCHCFRKFSWLAQACDDRIVLCPVTDKCISPTGIKLRNNTSLHSWSKEEFSKLRFTEFFASVLV